MDVPISSLDELLRQALTKVACAALIVDREGIIVWVNEFTERLTGYSADQLVGQTPSIFQSGRQGTAFYHKLWRTILSGDAWRGEMVNRRRDGTLYTADELITPLFDAQGDLTHFVAMQFDAEPRHREQSRQRFLAFHDSLTRLTNRARLEEILHDVVAQHAAEGLRFSLMFIDLDQFKPVNDTYGHHVGDLLLMAVANRLRAAVRKTDIVARHGGDEFVVVEFHLGSDSQPKRLAEALVASVGRPFRLAGHNIQIGASIGIATYPGDATTPAELLERADEAMYQAKAAGRNCVRVVGERV